MAKHESTSDKSAELARRDRAKLLETINAARALGAVSPGDSCADGGSGTDAPQVDDRFDPSLDLPLGIEPVGARPRELVSSERLTLPTMCCPRVSSFRRPSVKSRHLPPNWGPNIRDWVLGQDPRRGQGPAHFSDPPTNPPTDHPTFVRVDLTGGESRSEIAHSLVEAVIEAAHAPRRPQHLLYDYVDEEREDRWPELRDHGPRLDGLRDRLVVASACAVDAEHVGRWFCDMAAAVLHEAFDSGVAVHITGTASMPSGFQVTWHPGKHDHGCPCINLTASAYKLDETIRHVIDLILFAHAVDADSEQGQALARAMWAAAVARLTPVPEAPPF